tara:strand:+ start:489 stop:680 length:192 start_codon:yes stop_codon:yes gene_type:complete
MKQGYLTVANVETWFEVVWDALESFRANEIPEGDPLNDDRWSEICTAMAWIVEEFNDKNKEEL